MAQVQTAEARVSADTPATPGPTAEQVAAATGFGAEFRELARQRRFVRAEPAAAAAAPAPAAPGTPAALPRMPKPAAHRTHPDTPVWRSALPNDPVPAPSPRAVAAPVAAAPTVPQPARAQASAPVAARMSAYEHSALTELARLSDELVRTTSKLAATIVRAERAEADLAAASDRILAARALVRDAQDATRAAAERAAYLEGRCETLEEQLDRALNSSWLSRWRHRRRHAS